MSVNKDIAIDRVREVRHQISAKFDHDTQRMIDHYLEYQKRFRERLEPMSKPHFDVENDEVLKK